MMFSFQFGAEDPVDVAIRDGETVHSAWKRIAPQFGADPGRAVSFKAGGEHLASSDYPRQGQTIIASVSHETKGA